MSQSTSEGSSEGTITNDLQAMHEGLQNFASNLTKIEKKMKEVDKKITLVSAAQEREMYLRAQQFEHESRLRRKQSTE